VHLLDRLKRVLRGYFGLVGVAISAHFQGLKTGLNAFCFGFAKLVSTHWGAGFLYSNAIVALVFSTVVKCLFL
jgi:hypothetical protein